VNKVREKKQAAAAEAPKRSEPSKPMRLPRALIGVMNGSFLTKEAVLGNMRFILFCAGLMLGYIAYGYWTERTVRDLDQTNAELKEMRSEYLTVRSHLEQAQQQSHVASDISTLGLKESKTPPMRITVDEDHLETPQPE
jgi:Bacteriodetes cell division protein (FtsL-like)